MAQADLTANRDVVECLFRVSLLDGIDDYTDTLDVLSQGTELDALERLYFKAIRKREFIQFGGDCFGAKSVRVAPNS